MIIHDRNFELYITPQVMSENIKMVAAQINADFAQSTTPPLILITMDGAVIFAADLVRRLDFTTEIAYVKCSSYHGSMQSSENVMFDIEPTISPRGREVIVIEDVVDTGNTYQALHAHLIDLEAASVKIATMIIKPTVYNKSLQIDYVAAEVENIFIIGMGLDYNQLGRNLDGIYRLSE